MIALTYSAFLHAEAISLCWAIPVVGLDSGDVDIGFGI